MAKRKPAIEQPASFNMAIPNLCERSPKPHLAGVAEPPRPSRYSRLFLRQRRAGLKVVELLRLRGGDHTAAKGKHHHEGAIPSAPAVLATNYFFQIF